MPDLSQFPLKKGVSLLNSGFTPLGSLLGTSLVFSLIRTADIDDHRVLMGVDPLA